MTRREFVDTNVLLYAYDARHAVKQKQARELMAEFGQKRAMVLSTQVLMEFFSVGTTRLSIPPLEAQALVAQFAKLDVVDVQPALVLSAIEMSFRHQISHWDGLIVAAAKLRRCSVLWTEDLNDGQVIEGVRIANPFVSA